MSRLLILFVLVMSMVKTNAQTVYEQLLQNESNDKMLLKLHPGATIEDVNAVLRKIEDDPDFSTHSKGIAGYFVLDREPRSTISKKMALEFYMSEPHIAYASFVFMNDDQAFTGYANDVFVKAKPGVTRDEVISVAKRHGLISMLDYTPEDNLYLLYLDKAGNTYERSMTLFESGLFVFSEPNFFTTAMRPAAIGNKTNSISDCPCVRTPQTKDPEMTTFNQWGLYTGTSAEYASATNMQIPIAAGNGARIVPFMSDINVCRAWKLYNGSASNVDVLGSGIKVSVIDAGVDTRHLDLKMRMNGSIVYGYDPARYPLVGPPNPPVGNLIYNGATDPGCPDENYDPATCSTAVDHGTMVAGIISAKRNNTYPNPTLDPMGMAGVAPASEIMPVHAWWLDYPCAPVGTSSQVLYDAFKWSADNGADVINCSWGWNVYNTTRVAPRLIEDGIQYAVNNGRGGKGCVVVCAVGNQNWNQLAWPASNPNVIAVGASNMCNERKSAGPFPNTPWQPNLTYPGIVSCDAWETWGSNYGMGAQYTDGTGANLNCAGKLSVVAPGVEIISTNMDRPYSTPYYGTYRDHLAGTSAAAPHVAGVAALMLSVNPCLEWQEVKTLIEASADQINPVTPAYTYTSGWNNEMGYGRVNAGDAVTLSYDLYKQATTETGTKTYKSAHHIFAGASVTNIYKYPFPVSPNYIVAGGARINFFAPANNAVNLLPGFDAVNGSNFNAEIIADVCNNSHFHLKPASDDDQDNGMENFAQGRSNAVQEITIYPNPVNDVLNVSLSLAANDEVTFTVLNMLGQKAAEQATVNLTTGTHKHTISTSNLIPGVYTLVVRTKKGTDQFKFTKY